MASLVLNIGGPRLLYAFKEHLPSRSVVYKAIKNTNNITISLEKKLSEIITVNMKQFFQQYKDCYFSVKVDELAIVQRLRWDASTDEIFGLCYNCKDNVRS